MNKDDKFTPLHNSFLKCRQHMRLDGKEECDFEFSRAQQLNGKVSQNRLRRQIAQRMVTEESILSDVATVLQFLNTNFITSNDCTYEMILI